MIRKMVFFFFPDIEEKLDRLERENKELRAYTDVRNLMRRNLELVDLRLGGHENPLKGLTEQEIQEFEMWGSAVLASTWWKYLIEHTINAQAAKTLPATLYSDRAGWSGVGFVDACIELSKMVERLATARSRRLAGEEPYDDDYLIQN